MNIESLLPPESAMNARDELHERIRVRLMRHTSLIEQVQVSLKDINGPRGGKDWECTIRVRMQGHPDVFIRELDDQPGRATYYALERTVLGIQKSIERVRSKRKYHRRRYEEVPGSIH